MALPDATLSVQWGDWRVYKVGGKIFAWMSGGKPHTVSFKVNDVAFRLLTQIEGIRPSDYRARFNFVQLDSLRALPTAELRQRLVESHRTVADTLPKRLRPPLEPSRAKRR